MLKNHELHHGAIPSYSNKPNTYAGIRVTNLDDQDYSKGFTAKPRPPAKVAAKTSTRIAKNKRTTRRLSPAQSAYKKRKDKIKAVFDSNQALSKPNSKTMKSYFTVVEMVKDLKICGMDIVSVFSRAEKYGRGQRETSLWIIDRFHRLAVKPESLNRASLERRDVIVKDLLLQGYLVQPSDFDVSVETFVNVIKSLKKKGLDVCTVKCKSSSEGLRGFVVPCANNNLVEHNIKKAPKVWEL